MKQMKKIGLFKNVVAFILAFCMVIAMNVTVLADNDASPAVAAAREGVLQINLVYEEQNGTQHILETGSGFLIGASTGATTVITNYHVVSLDDEQKSNCTETFGVDFFNTNNINLKIQVVVKRDVVIDASYVNGSEKTDFAILELSQAIYDRSPLKFVYDDDVVETQKVYALGFPWVTSVVADDQVYTSEDVTITNGIVGKFQTINEISYILHGADLGYGNSGGPLVDSNGNVVGVNTMYSGDGSGNYFYSIAIGEIADVLNALGIVFEYADAAVTPMPDNSIQDNAGNNDTPVVTPTEQPVVTQQPVPTVPPAVADTSTNMMLIVGVIIAVVAVLIIVLVIVLVAGSKKKKSSTPVMTMGGMMGGQMNAMSGAMGGTPVPAQPVAPQPVRPTPPAINPNTAPYDSGAGETSVLGVGAGETGVLGVGSMQPAATLIRKKNGETATISKAVFNIGKERSKVDFCVPDNNSISRTHASIVCRGGVYSIVDKNSTNYTFVNGNKINPNQEVKLNSGDKIRLADEEFEFRM